MPIKSMQVIPVEAMRDGSPVVGICRIIKYEHQKDNPSAEGVPQRVVLLLNESGKPIVRITKFFRHLLLECDGAFETTDKMLKLTPNNVRLLADQLLSVPGRRGQILDAAIRRIEQLYSRQLADQDDAED